MATVRPKGGTQFRLCNRPRYLFEALLLISAISLLLLAYKYYFGSALDDRLCGKPLEELCFLDNEAITSCKIGQSCEDFKKRRNDGLDERKSKFSPVLVEVFYEVLCPDSKDFIIDQLYPAIQKIGDIMNVSLVPYGKASERLDGEEYIFTCQHGPRECKGNIIQTCAVSLLKEKDTTSAISFVHCMEVSHDPSSSGPACAKDVGIDFKPIEKCAGGKLGNQLQHTMAVRTDKLNPKLIWVPWIVLNGMHTEDIQSKALTDLRGLVCSNYKGTKSSGCED